MGLQPTCSGRCQAHTMPSANFCRPVGSDCSSLGPEFRTDGRSPEVSSTAFSAQPPDLQPTPLIDLDSVVISRLVRRRMPRIRFLSIGSRLCSTLPSDPASRRRPCASLGLHLHQVVEKGTLTLKLPNMLGTPIKRGSGNPLPLWSVRARDEPAILAPRARAMQSRSWSGRHRTIRSGYCPCSRPPGSGIPLPAPSTCQERPAVRRHSSPRTSR